MSWRLKVSNPRTNSNLISCALFWTVSLNTAPKHSHPNAIATALAPFKPLGFELPTQAFSIWFFPWLECFDELWITEFALDVKSPVNVVNPDFVCTPDIMFGSFDGNPRNCLQQLCSPKDVLNLDLGGIGVSLAPTESTCSAC